MSSGWEQVGRLKKELASTQAEHGKTGQQLKDLQTEKEELQKTLNDERKLRTLEQQQIQDLTWTTDQLRQEVARGQELLAAAEQAEASLTELQGEAAELRRQASEGNDRVKRELQDHQAERAKDLQQIKDLQIQNEELQKTVKDERSGRAIDQQIHNEGMQNLSATVDQLRADAGHGQDRGGPDTEHLERELRSLQEEAKELRKQASEANMWKARAEAVETQNNTPPGASRIGREQQPEAGNDRDDVFGDTVIGQLSHLDSKFTPQTVEALQVRVKELERQLARAERQLVAVQDSAGGKWSKIGQGVGNVICTAYRCLRAQREGKRIGYQPTPQDSHGPHDLTKLTGPDDQA